MLKEMKARYYLNEKREYVIENYNQVKPFASFLPSIAGLKGKPIWAYYVNRGQALASLGVNNKDYAIMEFYSAVDAYRQTSLQGFRTFLKIKKDNKVICYEPFQNYNINKNHDIRQKMYITSYDLRLEEINHTIGIKTEILYCTLPTENIPALIRSVSVTNISDEVLEIEVLDGLPVIVPYNIRNVDLKSIGNLVQAWMRVEHYDSIPFYKLTVSSFDDPEIQLVQGGNFYLNFDFDESDKASRQRTIINPTYVFGTSLDLAYPEVFFNTDFKIPETQVNIGFSPCGFGYKKITLESNHSDITYTLVGNTDAYEKIEEFAENKLTKQYLLSKIQENKEIVQKVKRHIFTSSNSPEFDEYCAQTFLDNSLRGGYPILLGKDRNVFYTYSRKHGDLEREYNFFHLDSTYYSQGNSNFRDVNQNRRSDVFFFPFTKDTNIKIFFNLLQLDGFNPLVVKGSSFIIEDKNKAKQLVHRFVEEDYVSKVLQYLDKAYTPGGFLNCLETNNISVIKGTSDELLNELLYISYREDLAEFGEGYWTDHWTYNNDLLEQYMAIYPEDAVKILFDENDYSYYDNYEIVAPRDKKYVLTENGVRQYDALIKVIEKQKMINSRTLEPNRVRTQHGKGEVYRCNLISKIVSLIVNKVSSFDSQGIGIEMEANKPGWCDALNGLPGIFGSSINDSVELKRLAVIVSNVLSSNQVSKNKSIKLPEEVYSFFNIIHSLLKSDISDFNYREKSYNIKEDYRSKVVFGLSGEEVEVSTAIVSDFLKLIIAKVDTGLSKAFNEKDGVHYTFYSSEVTEYQKLKDEQGNCLCDYKGRPYVKALKFEQKPLPYYLEGPVHIFRTVCDKASAENIHNAIKKTELYDKNLGMYKVNVDITETSTEIGRQNVFPRGWLENESVFLHMGYKYLLELLRCELYEEYFETIKTALVPFHNPETYGRSILENVSFIASSAYPDERVHGAGYQARLTGASAEFVNMWLYMTSGKKPFKINENGELYMQLDPAIPEWLFTREEKRIEIYKELGVEEIVLPKNTFAFTFLGKILTVYHNDNRKDICGANSLENCRIVIKKGNKSIEITGSIIPMPIAQEIRDGAVDRIDFYIK